MYCLVIYTRHMTGISFLSRFVTDSLGLSDSVLLLLARDWTIDIAGNAVIGCDHCPLRLHVTCSLTYLLSCINMTKFLASCCISAQQQQQQHHPFNSPLWQPRVSRYQNSVSCPIYHSHCPEISHNHSQTFLPVYNSLYNSAADCFGCWL